MSTMLGASDARTYQIIVEHDLEQLVAESQRIQLALPHGITAERGVARNVGAASDALRNLSHWLGDTREWQVPATQAALDRVIALMRTALEHADPEREAE